MKPLIFCNRCRGMEVGWNMTYLRHSLTCNRGLFRFLRVASFTATASLMVFIFPTHTVLPVVPAAETIASVPGPPQRAPEVDTPAPVDPSVAAIEDLLARHASVGGPQRERIARAVVSSARRHDVDPFLVTGVLLAESGGDAYAISHRQAVGIMQIHVPTWEATVEAEGLNLFVLEDNIDLGTRILKDYTRTFGLWEGVMRYLGVSQPTDEALAYVQRVQGVYSDRQAD